MRASFNDIKRYEKNLREGWDVVIPPLPIEPFNPIKAKTGVQKIENIGHTLLKVQENIDRLKSLAVRKVKVFVLDTAGNLDHINLQKATNNSLSKNFTTDPEPYDGNGHGTHCAGIIAASHDEYKLGIASELVNLGLLEVIPVKVLTDEGAGTYQWIESGIKYVNDLEVEEGCIKVISMSLGGPTSHSGISKQIKKAVDKGIFVFAAAGNSGYVEGEETLSFPGFDKNTICVGSIDDNYRRSSFSSVGEALDFVAPGKAIWSTYLDNKLVALSGTSMATPQLVGIACWLLSIYEDLDNQSEFYSFLVQFINDLGTPKKDTFYGHGLPVIDSYIKEKPGENPNENPPINEKTKTIILNNGGYSILWKYSNSKDKYLLNIDSLIISITDEEKSPKLWDSLSMFLEDVYFNGRRTVVISDSYDEEDALYWVGKFIEVVGKNEGLNLQVLQIEGTTSSHRSYLIKDFSRVYSTSEVKTIT